MSLLSRIKTLARARQPEPCPICSGVAAAFDSVDFNRSCLVTPGTPFEHSGEEIWYYLCGTCKFCFAAGMFAWTSAVMTRRIYNHQYQDIDPDFVESRPRNNSIALQKWFGGVLDQIDHLDYGGGAGRLTELLRQHGWRSCSYDPFFQSGAPPEPGKRYTLVTAFEILEHSNDPRGLMRSLAAQLDDYGLLVITTLLSDDAIDPGRKLDWWYAAPRNGHISLFSAEALHLLAEENGLFCETRNGLIHFLGKNLPDFAKPLLGIKP